MSEPERFTLDEARQELAKQECLLHGHRWDVIEAVLQGPVRIVCYRCGQTHAVRSKATEEPS